MSHSLMIFVLFASAAVATAAPTATSQARLPFLTPTSGGGSWLDVAGRGVGEPLNVIISGLSSPEILTDDGILNFAHALNFTTECAGLHLGDPQSANLGDGNGFVNQSFILREDFGNPVLGACLESFIGGNHFRVYRQNGTNANTDALFLAVSLEENLTQNHTISPDGYDVGRDSLVSRAAGMTSFGGVSYNTTVQRMLNVTAAGSAGVNHGIAIDGTVVLLTVNIQ